MQDLFRHGGAWASVTVAGLSALTPAAPAAPHSSLAWLRDMQTTLYARRALAEDAVLAPLNLGVSVRDGIATVWGPIPNDEIGRQALKRVGGVQGVLQVRGDLYILAPRREDESPEVPFVFEGPVRTESASPNRDSGQVGSLTGRVGPGFPEEPQGATAKGPVSLLAPVALAAGAGPQPAATPTNLVDPVTAAVDRLRRDDERFRGIATELKDGAVLLRGGGVPGEHVMAFARALSQVPGVQRVVVLGSGQ